MIGTFFKLIGKAFRFTVSRPLQRFNIYNRAKKYLGEDAKYFMPAPRAIGSLSHNVSSQYPHLEGSSSSFKSVKQRRLEAIQKRNQRLIEAEKSSPEVSEMGRRELSSKAYSETKSDDKVVIESSNQFPVIKTVALVEKGKEDASDENRIVNKTARPLPTSTNLQLSDPATIWHVDKVPPGRLDISKFQELMINKLADDLYWTPKQISETYNIKEEYAENIIRYFKQIRIILSPKVAVHLDYVARDDPFYKSYKDIIYHVDPSLRSAEDKIYDDTFLPTDELPEDVRKVLSAGQLRHSPDPRLTGLFKRPTPLKLESINRPDTSQIDDEAKRRRRLTEPGKAVSEKSDDGGQAKDS